jgi:hypothetical protein
MTKKIVGFQNLHPSLLQISTFFIFAQPKIQTISSWLFAHLWNTLLPTCRIFLRIFRNFKMSFSNFFKKELHVARSTKCFTPYRWVKFTIFISFALTSTAARFDQCWSAPHFTLSRLRACWPPSLPLQQHQSNQRNLFIWYISPVRLFRVGPYRRHNITVLSTLGRLGGCCRTPSLPL